MCIPETSKNKFRLGLSVTIIVLAVQIKHVSIWKPLKSDFVANLINKKLHQLLVYFVIYGHSRWFESFSNCTRKHEHFQIEPRGHKSRNALAFMRFPILIRGYIHGYMGNSSCRSLHCSWLYCICLLSNTTWNVIFLERRLVE